MSSKKKKELLPERFEFLKSTRFWKLVILAVLGTLQSNGYIDGELANTVTTIVEYILGGSVVIRTVDRTVDKLSATKK